MKRGHNTHSGKHLALPLGLHDGRNILRFTKKTRGHRLHSFDEQHWCETKQEAWNQATHLYDAAWGNRIEKAQQCDKHGNPNPEREHR